MSGSRSRWPTHWSGEPPTSCPDWPDAIRYREASTPLTNFHYTRNPRGAIEGYENTPANSGLGWLPHETPITNLFLAGAWTNSGGMNPAISSGMEAAQRDPGKITNLGVDVGARSI